MKKLVLDAWCLVLGALAANAAEITINVDEGQAFAYAIDGGELVRTEEVGPARVTFAANRNATYSFYEVAEDGTVTLLDEPLMVTDAGGETISESDNGEVAVDTRATKEIDGSAGAVTVDLTYSGDNWGESVAGNATIAVAFEGAEKPFVTDLTGEGTVTWNPKFGGTYVFKHMAGGVTETATFKLVRFPGMADNPWEIGANDAAAVTAYVNDGYLYLAGEGEVTEFTDGAPWTPLDDMLAGAVLPRTITLPASVLATLPISVKGGAEPSGAISGAEFERIEIVDGKAYLDVSVYTNSELKAKGEGGGWSVATNGVIEVPAPGKSGFFFLKTKGAK